MTEVVRRAQPDDAVALVGKPVSDRLQRIYDRHRGTCALCGGRTFLNVTQGHPQKATVDHIIPRSRGGTSRMENLQLACERCNREKADRVGPDTVRKLVAERDALLAEVKLLRAAAVDAARCKPAEAPPKHPPRGVSGQTLVAHQQSWAEQRKAWADQHQQMQREIARLKEHLRASPSGDLRYHLMCVERALETIRGAAHREQTLEGLQRAVEALVGKHLDEGRRFRGGEREEAERA